MNSIRISGKHFNQLKSHLFPGDDCEAVAIALCGRSFYKGKTKLMVQEIFLVPYDACMERTTNFVHWSTDVIVPQIEKAVKKGLSILKIHSHPQGYEQFSKLDDKSDKALFHSIHSWFEYEIPHASCVMLPSGKIFGRFIYQDFKTESVNQISVAGSTIHNWTYSTLSSIPPELQLRNMQTFGAGTIGTLNRLKIGVVGCSGTGSPIIEQLKRMGVGEMVLVDPDNIEKVNLNRIINATLDDAKNNVSKVEVMKRSITEAGFSTKVSIFASYITNTTVIKELADCDVLFGCVDGAEGRHVLNQIASYYLIPYFDLGVRIDADGAGGISSLHGSIHYIQPGGASLLSKGVYSSGQLEAEALRRVNPKLYGERLRNGYLIQVNESSPAVISINMQVAATAINDFLARINEYRNIDCKDVETTRIMFTELSMWAETPEPSCPYFSKMVGQADVEPLLHSQELRNDEKAA